MLLHCGHGMLTDPPLRAAVLLTSQQHCSPAIGHLVLQVRGVGKQHECPTGVPFQDCPHRDYSLHSNPKQAACVPCHADKHPQFYSSNGHHPVHTHLSQLHEEVAAPRVEHIAALHQPHLQEGRVQVVGMSCRQRCSRLNAKMT